MNAERWRCFVALPISDELRANLATAVGGWRLRPDLAALRWTDPRSWHVTLAFIGPIDPSAVPGLVARLTDAAAAHGPMMLRTGSVGGFPSAARARVAWYGVDDPDGKFAALASDVRRATGVAHETIFRGHVTLARARRDPVELRAWIRDARPPVGELAVDRIQLMRSHLGRGPVAYEVLGSIAVGAAAHV